MKKDIALVLSGGGARGAAHIGAIRELERRGYRIASVTGTSIGALVGFAYVSGRLDALEELLTSLSCDDMARLLDFTLSGNGLVRGERVFNRLRQAVPDCRIEDLPLPLVIVASDLTGAVPRVYIRGSAYRAVRASTAIPGVLTAVSEHRHTLVDGGVLDPLPLGYAVRVAGGLLVAVNLYAPSEASFVPVQGVPARKILAKHGLVDRMRDTWRELKAWRGDVMDYLLESSENTTSYAGLLKRAAALMMMRMAEQSIALWRPDIVVSVPLEAAGPLDFQKSRPLMRLGTARTVAALDAYEAAFGRGGALRRWFGRWRRRFVSG